MTTKWNEARWVAVEWQRSESSGDGVQKLRALGNEPGKGNEESENRLSI